MNKTIAARKKAHAIAKCKAIVGRKVTAGKDYAPMGAYVICMKFKDLGDVEVTARNAMMRALKDAGFYPDSCFGYGNGPMITERAFMSSKVWDDFVP